MEAYEHRRAISPSSDLGLKCDDVEEGRLGDEKGEDKHSWLVGIPSPVRSDRTALSPVSMNRRRTAAKSAQSFLTLQRQAAAYKAHAAKNGAPKSRAGRRFDARRNSVEINKYFEQISSGPGLDDEDDADQFFARQGSLNLSLAEHQMEAALHPLAEEPEEAESDPGEADGLPEQSSSNGTDEQAGTKIVEAGGSSGDQIVPTPFSVPRPEDALHEELATGRVAVDDSSTDGSQAQESSKVPLDGETSEQGSEEGLRAEVDQPPEEDDESQGQASMEATNCKPSFLASPVMQGDIQQRLPRKAPEPEAADPEDIGLCGDDCISPEQPKTVCCCEGSGQTDSAPDLQSGLPGSMVKPDTQARSLRGLQEGSSSLDDSPPQQKNMPEIGRSLKGLLSDFTALHTPVRLLTEQADEATPAAVKEWSESSPDGVAEPDDSPELASPVSATPLPSTESALCATVASVIRFPTPVEDSNLGLCTSARPASRPPSATEHPRWELWKEGETILAHTGSSTETPPAAAPQQSTAGDHGFLAASPRSPTGAAEQEASSKGSPGSEISAAADSGDEPIFAYVSASGIVTPAKAALTPAPRSGSKTSRFQPWTATKQPFVARLPTAAEEAGEESPEREAEQLGKLHLTESIADAQQPRTATPTLPTPREEQGSAPELHHQGASTTEAGEPEDSAESDPPPLDVQEHVELAEAAAHSLTDVRASFQQAEQQASGSLTGSPAAKPDSLAPATGLQSAFAAAGPPLAAQDEPAVLECLEELPSELMKDALSIPAAASIGLSRGDRVGSSGLSRFAPMQLAASFEQIPAGRSGKHLESAMVMQDLEERLSQIAIAGGDSQPEQLDSETQRASDESLPDSRATSVSGDGRLPSDAGLEPCAEPGLPDEPSPGGGDGTPEEPLMSEDLVQGGEAVEEGLQIRAASPNDGDEGAVRCRQLRGISGALPEGFLAETLPVGEGMAVDAEEAAVLHDPEPAVKDICDEFAEQTAGKARGTLLQAAGGRASSQDNSQVNDENLPEASNSAVAADKPPSALGQRTTSAVVPPSLSADSETSVPLQAAAASALPLTISARIAAATKQPSHIPRPSERARPPRASSICPSSSLPRLAAKAVPGRGAEAVAKPHVTLKQGNKPVSTAKNTSKIPRASAKIGATKTTSGATRLPMSRLGQAAVPTTSRLKPPSSRIGAPPKHQASPTPRMETELKSRLQTPTPLDRRTPEYERMLTAALADEASAFQGRGAKVANSPLEGARKPDQPTRMTAYDKHLREWGGDPLM